MTNSPENEQTPERAGAEGAGSASGSESTQQVPVEATQQVPVNPTQQFPPPPVAQQPPAEQPVAQQPPTQQPAAPQPPTQQPAAQQPWVQQPPAQQPPAPQPPVQHQAERPTSAPQMSTGWGHPAPQPPVGWGAPAAAQPAPVQPDASSNPFAAPGPNPHATNPQAGYPQAGYPQAGYQQAGFPQAGYPQPPYPPAGYPVDPATSAAPSGTTKVRPQRLWVSVVGAAAAAALIASFATAGFTGAFDNNNSKNATPASLSTLGTTTPDTAPVSGSSSDSPDWEKVASAVSSSVVAIQVTTTNGGAEGSGVIIDKAGHILTNNHVVSGADSVQVTLSDGRLYKAKIVGTDPTSDLAVVKLTNGPKDLSPAALGASDSAVVGEPVMAVGNPLGLANTVTTGIVSAVDRPVSASAETGNDVVVTNAIQIDAAINPGNSGGPLFDAKGRVLGITSSIATLSGSSGTSGSIGLGFAIPINLARNIAAQLVKTGTAEHAFLGVSLTDGKATADGVTRQGADVKEVSSGSPAADAGIKTGDVVVAINSKPVAGAESLTAYVRELAAKSTAKLTVVRSGKALDINVTLAAKAATADSSGSGSNGGTGQGQGGQNPFGQGNNG
ncbi:trypsin-like peptidase domain-containing protein [Pengzhenrongella sp.]|uniref:trypsin-like peptidase domain-containing protein n=1 Tax=Pengzhenrongella sp. TaxID=2888820 RepID=UPI002F94FDEB